MESFYKMTSLISWRSGLSITDEEKVLEYRISNYFVQSTDIIHYSLALLANSPASFLSTLRLVVLMGIKLLRGHILHC